jgi:hypothetical protein
VATCRTDSRPAGQALHQNDDNWRHRRGLACANLFRSHTISIDKASAVPYSHVLGIICTWHHHPALTGRLRLQQSHTPPSIISAASTTRKQINVKQKQWRFAALPYQWIRAVGNIAASLFIHGSIYVLVQVDVLQGLTTCTSSVPSVSPWPPPTHHHSCTPRTGYSSPPGTHSSPYKTQSAVSPPRPSPVSRTTPA